MIGEFKFSLTCSNARSGCGVTLEGEELQGHQEECKHRMVPCPKTSCTRKIKAIELWIHISTEHEVTSKPNGTRTLEMTNKTLQEDVIHWKSLAYMERDERRFFLQFVKRENVFMAWVQMEGSRREAAKWEFFIEAGKEEMASFRHGAVYSEDMTLEEILEAGAYLVLGNNQAKRILSGIQEGDDEDLAGNLNIKFIVTRKC